MKLLQSIRSKLVTGLFVSTIVSGLLLPVVAHATIVNPAPAAKISFTFDDGQASAYTQAAPTLAKYGLTGTNYAISGCVGMTTTPNTCRANPDVAYMSWTQIQALQNTYGWEIGSHTVDHDCLASNAKVDPDDCQTATLTAAQVDAEMANSKAALAAKGLNVTDFAPPYGDYSNLVLAKVAKYYASMRGFKEQGSNTWPLDDYLLNNVTVQEKTDTVASLEAKIDTAITNNTWIILSFHDIEVTPSQDPTDYQYGTAELDQLAAYVKDKQTAGKIQSVNVNKGLVASDTNMLANGSFNDGIADGWTTDSSTNISKDTASNGSYPDATNSIKLTSGTSGKNSHLFSPTVAVNPSTSYMFKNFLNVSSITTGAVGFYVDEYDANGNWISGQYLKQENSAFVENMNFTYKPTSLNVTKASLQVIVAGTGITAYLDNSQMFALNTPPAQTNLVANGTFDSGITNGWATNSPTTITADKASNGSPSNVVNSVKLTNTTQNTYLFSPKVAVSSTRTYTLSNYLNLKTITSGEVGFYIDEYDANGNWISGQYKLGVHAVSAGDINFGYVPSSANVAKASLQVIVMGNSGISGYFDDSRWYQN